eukprot:Skav220547  [mRNA]  locus=scaffold761:64316:68135:- [translate_table: standard]
MRGGGRGKDKSRDPKEQGLFQRLQILLQSVEDESANTDDAEAKLLTDLKALVRDHKKGSLLQQLKSLVTQATRSAKPSREPKQQAAAPQKSQTFYTSWPQAKGQKARERSWAEVASSGRAQWAKDDWQEIAWKPRQDDWSTADRARVSIVTSFQTLENKLEEDSSQAMVFVTSDTDELPMCLEMLGGDVNSRVTVIYSSASDLPDQIERWQDKASRGRVPGYFYGKLQSRVDTWGFELEPNAKVIRGLMRVRGRKAVQDLLACSGRMNNGVRWFTELKDKRQLPDEPQEVLWIDWKDFEEWPDYIARASNEATHGLVRGRYQLGLRVHRTDERWSPSTCMWRLQKVPRHWEYVDVEEAAQQMGFEDVHILSKGRNGFSNSWTFRAKRKDSLEFVSSELEEAESEGTSSPVELFAVKEVRRRGPQSYSVRTLQPERTVRYAFSNPEEFQGAVGQSQKDEMEVDSVEAAKGAADEVEEEDRNKEKEDKQKSGNKEPDKLLADRSRSPAHNRAKGKGKTSSAAQLLKTGSVASKYFHGGTVVKNAGRGNCLYLACAQALSKLEGKNRSHRQIRAFVTQTFREKKDIYEPRWLRIDDKGNPTSMSFDAYVDLQGKLGSWAGAFEVEVLALALTRRFWICDDENAYLFNDEGEGPPVVLQYGQEHYQNVEGADENLLAQRRKRHTKDSSQAFRGCGPSGVASLRLSDFATEVGTSKKVGSASSCKSQRSCRLTDFASVRAARSSSRVAARPQHTHKEDFHTWACDRCKTVLAAGSRLQLSAKRRNHIYNKHRYEERSLFHQIRKTYVPVEALERSMVQHVGWQCGFCLRALPVMEGEEQWFRASINAHLSKCSKAPKGATSYDNQLALNKRCGLKKPGLKGARAHSLAWARNMQQKGLAGMATIQEKSVHSLVRIDSDAENRAMFACTRCTRHWRSLNELRISHFKRSASQKCSAEMREGLLSCGKKRTFWGTLSRRWKNKVASAWRLSTQERKELNKACNLTKQRPTKRKREWQRDLTREGVEPNPGPLQSSLGCVTVNIQGQDNMFTFLSILTGLSSKPSVVAVQETNLDAIKRAQVLHALAQLGYAAWASQTVAKVDSAGRKYHRGGVLVAVRGNAKAAWHAEFDEQGGQVLTVDIGTCLVSSCWRRPDHSEDAEAEFWSHITETTQDAQSRGIPWIGLGDWNHTPEELWMCKHGYYTLVLG